MYNLTIKWPQQSRGSRARPSGHLFLLLLTLKKYYTQTVDQDDLISIGTIGLIKGISSYKPEKNVRLATYAARCIENAILSERTKTSGKRQFEYMWIKMQMELENSICTIEVCSF